MPDAPKTEDPKPSTPPWGDDANFDAARAWTLIENLKADVEKIKVERDTIKTDRDSLKTAADTAADAEKTEAQKIADRAAAAEERAKTAERSLWTERALRKHPLPAGLDEETEAEFLAFLSGESAEEIERKAARLAALSGKAETPGEAPANSTRPTPNLTPGHGGTPPVPFDAAAVAKAARSSAY